MSEGETGGDGDPDLKVAPGWYPDPRGSGNLFYWDGSKWTGDVRAPVSKEPIRAFQQLDNAHMLVVAGGAALAISPFLTWVKVVLLGDLNLFQLFSASGRSNGWAWAALVAGAAASFVALHEQESSTVRGTGLSVGLLSGALAIYALESLLHNVREASGLATVGIGPYVAVGGCIAMVIGALTAKGKAVAIRK